MIIPEMPACELMAWIWAISFVTFVALLVWSLRKDRNVYDDER